MLNGDGFKGFAARSPRFDSLVSMGNEEADKKFTWVIENFSYVQSKTIFSKKIVIGGCKWILLAQPNKLGNANNLSLFLMVAEYNTLPCGWRRYARSRLTIVNQLSERLSECREEIQCWFDGKRFYYKCGEMVSLTHLNIKCGSFVNNNVKIVVEVDVLQVIGSLDVSEKSQEVTQPLKRIKLNGDKETSLVDVNGFQVLPSQAESVKRIFERHPDMALEFRAKNQPLRTSCINVLLNLIETLCLSLQDLSIDDLGQAEQALTYLKYSGFKVDWLEHKLEELKQNKIEEHISKTRMQELEALLEKEKEELKDLKQKCSETEALLEKEKTKVLAATRAPPLTLDDVV